MLDVIATIAGLLGLSAKDLTSKYTDVQAQVASKGSIRRAKQELDYATPDRARTLLDRYYGSEQGSLARYTCHVGDRDVSTTIYTRPEWLGVAKQPLHMQMDLIPGKQVGALKHNPNVIADYSLRVLARLELAGVRIWNSNIYRMMASPSDDWRTSFTTVPFFDYRFSYGLLADELADALIACRGRLGSIDNVRSSLPLRSHLLPTLTSLEMPDSRVCCGGPGVLLALKRKKDYLIPVQIRSQQVSDGRGLRAIIPKAFHEYAVDAASEVNIYWTTFRELYEEAFGGEDAERDVKALSHDWYFDRADGLRWFEQNDSFVCEVTCFGFNAVAGNFEFGLLLAIHDSAYEARFRRQMQGNWEEAGVEWVSSLDTARLLDVMTDVNWAHESLFKFLEGLQRLKQLDPECVELPDLQRTALLATARH